MQQQIAQNGINIPAYNVYKQSIEQIGTIGTNNQSSCLSRYWSKERLHTPTGTQAYFKNQDLLDHKSVNVVNTHLSLVPLVLLSLTSQ